MDRSKLVVALYYHPEVFPPTLNAVSELSKCFGEITLVFRPHIRGTWQYPSNVKQNPSGSLISSSAQEQSPVVKKIFFFLQFTWVLFKACLKRPGVVLLYDPIALFAYRIIKPFLFFRPVVWYHNHDIAELQKLRKFSVGWFACREEKTIFDKIDIFTLPAAERLQFFPMDKFKGKYFIVPNYPAIGFYGPFYQAKKAGPEIKLLFQGRIGEGHGLEEIIPLLTKQIGEKSVKLVLKGYCEEAYKDQLIKLAAAHQAEDRVIFIGFTPYAEVPAVTASCDIGIGIFSKMEVMHVTLGSASNKLYEYAAVGLPVLYLSERHFSAYLGKYEWAFPVQLSSESIYAQVELIMKNYSYYSSCAHKSFMETLNFENCFRQVTGFLLEEELVAVN
jgi:glycosyltransferase involved in cell wall biosynthesis